MDYLLREFRLSTWRLSGSRLLAVEAKAAAHAEFVAPPSREMACNRGAAQYFADNPSSMPLEIAFQTRELRATCESPTRAKRELGELGSNALRRLLADMKAVETVAELFEMGLEIENCAPEHGMLRFTLSEALSLHCNANQQSVPMNGETIDWAHVTRLKVDRIGSGK